MSNTGTIHIALKLDDKGVVRVIRQVGKESSEAGRKGEKAFNDMDRSAKAFTGSAKMSISALLKMGAGVAGIYTVTAALKKAASVIKQVDTALWNAGTSYDRTVKALEAITGSSAGAAQQIEYLRVVSARYGQNLYDILPAYKNFLAATSKSGMSLQDTRTIFEGATKAIASMGLTSEETHRVLYALQQMVSKGMTGIAEEVNQQLGEVLPGAFGMFADSLDVSQKKLREMMEQGQLTLNDLVKFGAYMGNEFTGEISEAVAAQNRFNQEWQDLKIKMAGSGFMDSMTEAIKNLTKVIQDPELIQGLSRLVGLAIKLTEVSAEAAAWVGNLIGRHSAMWEAQKGFEEGLIPAYGMVGEQNRNKYLEAYRDIKKAADEAYKAIKTGGIATQKEIDAAIKVTSKALEKLEPLRLKPGQGSPFKSDWEAQDQISALEKELKSLEELNKKLKSEFETPWVLNWGTEVAKQAEIVIEAVEPTKEFIKAQSDLNEAWVKLSKSAEEYDKFKIDEWYNAEAKALGGVTPKLKEVYELMLKKNKAKHEEIALEKAYKEVRDAVSDNYQNSWQAELDRFDADNIKDLAEERKATWQKSEKDIRDASEKSKKEYEKRMDEQKAASLDFADTVKDHTADIVNNYDGMAKTIVNIVKRMIADMAATILSQEILVPIGLKIGSALGASWNGVPFSAMQSPAAANGGISPGSLLSSGNSLYNSFGIGDFLNSGAGGKIGSSVFGNAAWFGTPYFGAAEYMVPAAYGAAGSTAGGIASALGTLAPIAGIAAIALPILMKAFKNEKDPLVAFHFGYDYPTMVTKTLPVNDYSDGGTYTDILQERPGSVTSDMGFFTYSQKMSGETNAAVKDYFEKQFSAIDDSLAINFEDVIKQKALESEAGLKPGEIGTGWNPDTYGGLEGALKEANNWVAKSLAATFAEAYGLNASISPGLFEKLIPEGSDSMFDAFVRFGKVMESTEDAVSKFNRQLEITSGNAEQAFLNMETISGVFSSMDAMLDPVTKLNNPLVTIIDQFNTWIDALYAANAGLDEITRAEQKRTEALGAQLTGLTAQTVSQSLQQSIISGESVNLKQLMGSSIAAAMSASLTGTYMSGVLSDFQEMVGKSFLDAGQDVQVFLDFLPDVVNRLDLSSLTDQADAFAAKWQSLFGSDSQSLINDRNSAAQAYLTGLENELSILENNLNTAKSTYLDLLSDELSAQKNLVSDLQSSIRSIESFRAGTGSLDDMTLAGQKNWLNSLAASASGDNPDSISALLTGAGDYLDSFRKKSTSYADYAMEAAKTSNILKGVEDTAKDQLAKAGDQISYLQSIVDEVNGVSGRITDLDTARSAYESARMDFDNSWMQKEIETLESILNGVKSLDSLKANYVSAQSAVAGAQTGSSGSFGAMDYYASRPDVWNAYLNNDFTKNPITADAFAKQHYANSGKDEGTKWSFSGGGSLSGPESGYEVTATFHGKERIIPENMIGGNEDLIEEIRNLREDLKVANYQIAKNSQDTARILRRFDDTDALLVRVVA